MSFILKLARLLGQSALISVVFKHLHFLRTNQMFPFAQMPAGTHIPVVFSVRFSLPAGFKCKNAYKSHASVKSNFCNLSAQSYIKFLIFFFVLNTPFGL